MSRRRAIAWAIALYTVGVPVFALGLHDGRVAEAVALTLCWYGGAIVVVALGLALHDDSPAPSGWSRPTEGFYGARELPPLPPKYPEAD